MRRDIIGPGIFTLSPVLSEARCRELIERSEAIGYRAAPITTSMGPLMAPEIRNNTRVMLDDPELGHSIYRELELRLPEQMRGGAELVGLNERFRFYRYEPQQAFRWHRDGAFRRSHEERSRLTLLIYLNQEFEEGGTEFRLLEGPLAVHPRTGMALVFEHGHLHQGAPVLRGTKYVLRTDVMYRRPLEQRPRG